MRVAMIRPPRTARPVQRAWPSTPPTHTPYTSSRAAGGRKWESILMPGCHQPPPTPLLPCDYSLPPHTWMGGGGWTSKGWCRKTRCETKRHQASVPQLYQQREVASYSLLGESQLIVGHFQVTLQECCASFIWLSSICFKARPDRCLDE